MSEGRKIDLVKVVLSLTEVVEESPDTGPLAVN